MRCGCKGNCATIRCACFKVKVDCTLRCHGRNSGAQCANTGDSAAPSGTFRLGLNTERIVPPGSSQNPKRDKQIDEETLGRRLLVILLPLWTALIMVQRVVRRFRLAQRISTGCDDGAQH